MVRGAPLTGGGVTVAVFVGEFVGTGGVPAGVGVSVGVSVATGTAVGVKMHWSPRLTQSPMCSAATRPLSASPEIAMPAAASSANASSAAFVPALCIVSITHLPSER